MNKRGQMYILAAIIIAFAIFAIIAPRNVVQKTVTETNFEEIAQNFEKESAKFLNHILENNIKDIEDEFLNFTILFTSYAKTKNKDFGLIYAFAKDNTLYLGNYDKKEVEFYVEGNISGSLSGCFEDIDAQFSVLGLNIAIENLDIDSYKYCKTETRINAALLPPYEFELILKEDNTTTPIKTYLEPSHPDLIIVARESSGNIRKVYIKGETREV